MNMRWFSCFLFIIAVPNLSVAASFDCSKAKSKIELSICSDAELSALDDRLSLAYIAAVKSHPVKNYVKSTQKVWLDEIRGCSGDCLGFWKKSYSERINELTLNSNFVVFSSSEEFSYTSGDAVVEIIPEGALFKFKIWGGFKQHQVASKDAGKPMYTGCSFIGHTKDLGSGIAFDRNNSVKFKIQGNTLDIISESGVCEGFGSLPERFFKRQ